MPKGKNQKFKLYRLAQIMLENTDEEHYITMPEIKEKLEEYEVTADRKSIYNDLKDLEKLGIEVEGEPVGNRYHYHVVERPFELPELKLLVDAIQSSKFITQKKTNTLIKKLEKLVSKYDAQKLQRQVYVSGRIKAMNESIYYTVDAIHNAISEKDYIFATIQTLSKEETLQRYSRQRFDAIVIDEAHHSAANSYKKVLEYFQPKLWLGMTATPDKRDDNLEGRNIYEIFNHQIAYEIRLQDAMEEDLKERFAGEEVHLEAAYTCSAEEAQEWKAEIEARFPGYDVVMNPLSLSVSCHIGPGARAIACSRKIKL